MSACAWLYRAACGRACGAPLSPQAASTPDPCPHDAPSLADVQHPPPEQTAGPAADAEGAPRQHERPAAGEFSPPPLESNICRFSLSPVQRAGRRGTTTADVHIILLRLAGVKLQTEMKIQSRDKLTLRQESFCSSVVAGGGGSSSWTVNRKALSPRLTGAEDGS